MNANPKPVVSPLLILVCGIFAVSTSSVFIRLAQREANSLVIAAYRLTLASLVLIPFVWQKREELRRLKPAQVRLILLSGLFLALHFATWISSLAYTSVASSVVLVTTNPLWVALFSPFFLRERLTKWVWVGLVVALAGGVLVGTSEACNLGGGGLVCPPLAEFIQGRAFFGNLLALAGAFLAAGYLIVGRKLRPTVSLVSYIGTVYPTAAVILVIIALVSGQAIGGFGAPIYLSFLAMALIPQLLGHTSYNYALGYLPAAYVSVATLAEPIGTSILAVIVLSEAPSALEIIGGVIILAGIGLASWNRN